jgi:hypothetical protein
MLKKIFSSKITWLIMAGGILFLIWAYNNAQKQLED